MVTHLSNGTLTVQYPWYAGAVLLALAALLLVGGVQWFRSLRREGGRTVKKIKAVLTVLIGVVLLLGSVFLLSYKLTVGPSGVATSLVGYANALKWADVRAVSYQHRETVSLKGRKEVRERFVLQGATGRTVFVTLENYPDELVKQIGGMVAENVPKGARSQPRGVGPDDGRSAGNGTVRTYQFELALRVAPTSWFLSVHPNANRTHKNRLVRATPRDSSMTCRTMS